MKTLLVKAFYIWRDRLVRNYNLLLNKFIVIPPDILSKPPQAQKVLVVAPHSDDEVIGCGGTILMLARQGAEVEVAIVTCGEKGSEEGNIIQTRKDEAQAAADILGAKRLTFLGFADGNLGSSEKLQDALRSLLEQTRPDLVFAPNIFDNHPDHVAIGRQLVAIARNCPIDFQCYFFEVWTPLVANTIVDISAEIETKIQAMKAHKSQQNHTDFVEMILGMNRYRAVAALSGNPSMKYAEAFFRLNKTELGKLERALK